MVIARMVESPMSIVPAVMECQLTWKEMSRWISIPVTSTRVQSLLSPASNNIAEMDRRRTAFYKAGEERPNLDSICRTTTGRDDMI